MISALIIGIVVFFLIVFNHLWIYNTIIHNIDRSFRFNTSKRYVIHKDLHQGKWGYIVFDRVKKSPARSYNCPDYVWYPTKERANAAADEWNELHTEVQE